ncbi:MFS transporter [Burkholderia pseudomultivorans]|uniref:Lysophospholipid transporter LplT n=1 Tax=Burkholderia pseudomultivorans TaxID=1207504 RepID=A0ABU2E925_9BURK|nr:MFS transporter [Burkholderia pseudomultivorans]MDR8730753.1 Lysophospholipid transporter LplT [Burkholderia pseudomultivorans]MDR8738268.1 Lysophospholipid transporter LplT [Burkholderia pseudomultivorans]MDR8744623.1 Lysophospholipid transporter LplT [Burkholderia pseudomultivorans]MDR8756371.1 Lysophospholipid transporter LplT [Burkholderia pseudomultivorans]MDR8781078.1 Lysophospholipid transporter LplT [Burkholderia pseudomultivorans]
MSDQTQVSSGRRSERRAHASQFDLLRERRFAPFFTTQFLGALNDNVFKIGFTSLVTYHTARFSGVDAKTAAFLISAIFILPFVLFSATSGQIADKYDKATLTRFVKTFEIVLMLVGAAGFVTHSAVLLYLCTFMMGMHSTLFGPVKYSYLPQHLAEQELVGGNGLVEMGTFIAILIGTIVGGAAAGIDGSGERVLAVSVVVIALAGRLVAQRVPATPAPQPDLVINWNPFSETWRNLALARQNRTVFLSLLGISWLWFVGATFLTSFFNFAKDVLSASPDVVTVLLATFSVGIGLGSLLCERLSQRRVEIGLVPLGSIGISVFAIELYFASRALPSPGHLLSVGEFLAGARHWRILVDLFLLAMFGGFYSVPLYALIQSRSAPTHRARIIAANNILNALFMILSALMAMGLTKAGVGIPGLFLVTALLNVVVAAYIYLLVPEFLLRFVAWVLVHTFYRIRLVHAERIPEEGAAVLVCNHVSYVDALVLAAASPRPIRFVMDHRIFKTRFASWVFRHAKAIPIAPRHEDPAMLARAYDACEAALKDGELVCIFPEGKLTRTGDINTFHHGITEILRRTPVPVIPMALRGLWGSVFSRHAQAKLPRPVTRGVMSRLTLAVGEPIPSTLATPEALQAAVSELRGARK